MKTFSKVLSMILVGVMCFGLFATSAFASEFVFNDDGGSVAQSADFGGGDFSFESAGSGFSFENAEPAAASDGFVLEAEQPAAPAQDGGFALNEGDKQTAEQTADEEEVATGFKFEDTETFDKRYSTTDSYTFSISPKSIEKSDPKDVAITSSGTQIEPDTFDAIAYTKSGAYINATQIAESNLIKEYGKVTLKKEWLKNLSEGTYYLWGLPALGAPVYLGYVQVNPGNFGTFTVTNSPYAQYSAAGKEVTVTGNISLLARFGIVPVSNTSGGQILTSADYTATTSSLVFTREFLNSLKAGEYYIIGFPSATSTSEQVQMGKMTIKGATDDGTINPDTGKAWYLTPDYYISWTSGDDYLRFWSDLMQKRHFYPNYNIVLRYGVGAGSIPTKVVDVNQFWDFDDGSFALGTNFLNSLPAGTYTLQVVDLKPHTTSPVGACTNIVTFRIGAKLIPIDSDKHVINSIRNLRFLCDEPISQVYVGNIPLEYGVDYALSANRKTVTLSYEFLNKRSAGNTYTIKVLTDSGDYCSTTFQILTTAQGGASPRTGDESNLGLWAAFLLLSGTAVVVLLPKLRKHGM